MGDFVADDARLAEMHGYEAVRRVHLGAMVSPRGGVSPRCARTPRRITMNAASRETWTLTAAAVTCPRCRKVMADA